MEWTFKPYPPSKRGAHYDVKGELLAGALYGIITDDERKRVVLKVDPETKVCIVSLKILNSLFTNAVWEGTYDFRDSHCMCGHAIQSVFTIKHKETNKSYTIGSCCMTMCRISSTGKMDENIRKCVYCDKKLSPDIITDSHKGCRAKKVVFNCLKAWHSTTVCPCDAKYKGLSMRKIKIESI